MAAYLIVDIEITDSEAFAEYRRLVPAFIERHGGRYLARGGAVSVLEGSWQPRRAVILEFPNMAALKSFHEDPAYQPLRELRERSTRSNLVAIEGV
ncbi:MAG TPA: DUF1330 domain-containing protein [Candidatus Polarisedimenticolaceae bacterium]|nr:DUF1330 domain-containing protein [Candidatus Polarisedimenticolaceae bacterium]